MASFDWTRASEYLDERYGRDVVGIEEWHWLLMTLRDHVRAEQPDPVLAAFDEFLRRLRDIETKPFACRVFVSHQQVDVPLAERIAWLAQRAGFEYWLDVHDPLLNLGTGSGLPPVIQTVLIAAIIEMALLNCSHGITVQTANAQRSRWVPYEFGRAKRRWLRSTQVASWFDNGIYATTTADYLKLGVCALGEKDVDRWLHTEHRRSGCPAASASWPGSGIPQPLPN